MILRTNWSTSTFSLTNVCLGVVEPRVTFQTNSRQKVAQVSTEMSSLTRVVCLVVVQENVGHTRKPLETMGPKTTTQWKKQQTKQVRILFIENNSKVLIG